MFVKKLIKKAIRLIFDYVPVGYLDDELSKRMMIYEASNYIRVAGSNDRIFPSYYEFGCHSGRTFSYAIEAFTDLQMDTKYFYAFDSFRGLPAVNESESGIFFEGQFSTTEDEFRKSVFNRTKCRIADYQIVNGFYNEIKEGFDKTRYPPVGVLHIDVDLAESCSDALEIISGLLNPGSVLLVDDYYCFPPHSGLGVAAALDQFVDSNNGLTLIPWKTYGSFGKAFFVGRGPI